MILVGNQRGGARDLARHLMKDENDHVHVHEIRGFVADDLMGAFKEAEALSKGTRCRQFLFSLSLNPPQDERCSIASFEAAIAQAEERLGLTDQPRAIVFHEKEGRRHAHAVWSRIDTEQMKAVQLSHSKTKLAALSKQLYLDHGWRLPAGHIDRSLRDPPNFTLEEWQQAKRTGQDPRAIKTAIKEAWAVSDDQASFTQALRERGYTLARGNRRSFVAVDAFGEVYSVPRQIGVKTKDVRDRLGKADTLPDVDIVKSEKADALSNKLTGFVNEIDAQAERQKAAFKQKLHDLRTRQRSERRALIEAQQQRRTLEAQTRQARFRKGLKGVWDILRGEHWRISQENKRDAQAALKRDQAEFEAQIEKHLDERQTLKLELAQAKRVAENLNTQRANLVEELEKSMQATPQKRPAPQKQMRM